MTKSCIITCFPDQYKDREFIFKQIINELKVSSKRIAHWEIVRRSIDSRKGRPKVRLKIEVYIDEQPQPEKKYSAKLKKATNKKVLIVGAGPAGYFAALKLLEVGIRPIILDRGKDVRARRKDLRNLQQESIIDPHSNYCFGEGGAGTYSDGKLYTRSKKRGNIKEVLKILVEHGASEEILIDAHPHIGSNRLPKVIESIRKNILSFGGEVLFEHFVNDIIIKNGRFCGLRVNGNKEITGDNLILATGHSARDIYEMFHNKGLLLESKPFAMGVRLEHPQALIDEIQYRQKPREEMLPAARYAMNCQIKNKGIFSFCMCPGGFIVPAATAPGEIVINGMSLSKRDSPYANAGIVATIDGNDYGHFAKHGALAGLYFQSSIEKKVFLNNDNAMQNAPAQRMMDFINGKFSNTLPDTSYIPGIYSERLDQLLPVNIAEPLKQGLKVFGKKMKHYMTNEAKLLAIESRTSSPVRIPRDTLSLEHPQIKGLFPCGEGAGYAGGIMSAAIDGQKVANKISEKLN